LDLGRLLLSFEGRINRQPYWLFVLAVVAIEAALLAISGDSYGLLIVFGFAIIWPSLAMQVKRWHDRNKSGWWILITLVPLIGPIWSLIEVGFLRGTVGPNRYGPDPLAGPQTA